MPGEVRLRPDILIVGAGPTGLAFLRAAMLVGIRYGTACAGVFDGPPARWGAKRRAVRMLETA